MLRNYVTGLNRSLKNGLQMEHRKTEKELVVEPNNFAMVASIVLVELVKVNECHDFYLENKLSISDVLE